MTLILMFAIGLISGIISGMGIGGGTILIPALSIFFDMPQKAAQSINLIYFIPTAAAALLLHSKNKRIETKVLWKIILFGFVGAFIGASLAGFMTNNLLKKLFGCFLLIMGISEIFKKNTIKEDKNGRQ